ncbi:MAG: FAD-dependent oxidoreductase [Desulfobacterales bacterium]|nr:FAD-dependent oxidoreductase [Desulfobacterales bacterium]
MPKRVVIIGAVALGPKVAARIKRLDPSTEVTLLDRDKLISYGGCGIPYYVGGDVADVEGLRSTSAHILRDEIFFRNAKGVAVHHKEVTAIDRKNKTVTTVSVSDGKEEIIEYDQLVIATGASPFIPPLEGVDLPGVTPLTNLHQAQLVKDMISQGRVEKAVVIGGGAIGLEIAEALTDLWGIETTLVEMMDQLMPMAFGKDMSLPIENHMKEKDVKLILGERVTGIVGDKKTGVTAVETTAGTLPCELVILSVGARPNSELAKDAGLAIGALGGIIVNSCMKTSDPNIYAGGDCVEVPHLVSGQSVHMPLGSLANRQGRIIGTNICGGCDQLHGAVGTFCLKIFDLGIARAGLTLKQAKAAGFDAVQAIVVQSDRAHFYPEMELMYIKLIADRRTRKVLGIEGIGSAGDAVKSRIDSVAVLLKHGVTVEEISALEVGYAPPFASAMDIINNAGNTLENTIDGSHDPIDVMDFLQEFKNNNQRVLDVRSDAQTGPFVEKYKERWIGIPQEELINRMDEVPKDEPLYLLCGSGIRSYEVQLVLRRNGITNNKNIMGGIGMLKLTDPDFAPEE